MNYTPPHSWLGRNDSISSDGYYQEGIYEDLLEPRRHFGEFWWVLHAFKEPIPAQWRYHGSHIKPALTSGGSDDVNNISSSGEPPYYNETTENTTPKDIIDRVLSSPRVKYGIQVMVDEAGLPEVTVIAEAKEILNEMAHNLDKTSARLSAFFVCKAFKRLFRRIFVNRDGVESLRQSTLNYPVVIMPTHRSYADFLLMSYVCLQYDIPLPVIAAAQDFLNMKFFGSVLRNCGAFFIRRSFISDPLYWLLFSEYVQFHIRQCNHPVEFYIEGKRSRTGKALLPKVGMLGTIFESFFTGQVPDILLIPVTINYERILEESLHAYELLGLPKPKESASGLLKARSILQNDYGHVHIHVGAPLSLRELTNKTLKRFQHSLQCRLMSHQLFPNEINHVKHLSRVVVAHQMSNSMISPLQMIATCLIIHSQQLSSSSNPVPINNLAVNDLLANAYKLCQLLQNLGASVSWPAGVSSDIQLQYETIWQRMLSVHSALLHVTTIENVSYTSPAFLYALVNETTQLNDSNNGDAIIPIMANYFQLTLYRNHLLHILFRECLVYLVLNAHAPLPVALHQLYQEVELLLTLFSHEFVFEAYSLNQNVDIALKNLRSLEFIGLRDKTVDENIEYYEVLPPSADCQWQSELLLDLVQPYLFAYFFYLAALNSSLFSLAMQNEKKKLLSNLQKLGFQFIQRLQKSNSNDGVDDELPVVCRLGFQYLCLDTLDNASAGWHKVQHLHANCLSLQSLVTQLATYFPKDVSSITVQQRFASLLNTTFQFDEQEAAPLQRPRL